MNFDEIRRVTITALFSDDVLMEHLVLKGGNALSLVYGISDRTSLDLDFSMDADFPDLEDARKRLFHAIKDRFDAVGYVVFDEVLESKPLLNSEDEKPWWGGYELRFKLIEREKHERLRTRLEKLRFNASVVGPGQDRTFKVDPSKFEFTAAKASVDFDDYKIYVYSPEMIVIEKLRAICQQLPEYTHRGRRSPRARDFYDIHRVLTIRNINITGPENVELIRRIFEAKQVPLSFLGRVREEREFHRTDWPSVIASTKGSIAEFDYYFDFVVIQIERLQPFWMK